MIKPLFCEKCNQDREYVTIEEKFLYRVKKECFEIEGKRAFCNFCGEEIFHLDFETENQTKAFDAYRQKYNLLKPEEIKSIREQYQLSQHDFSILLGFSPNTISRFERGSIQTPEQNQKIKECKSHTKMLELLEQNGNKLDKEVTEKIMNSSKELSVSEAESETVIQFDESTNLATVYTASWSVARTLKKLGYPLQKSEDGAWWFKIPVNSMRSPSSLSSAEKKIVNSVYNTISNEL